MKHCLSLLGCLFLVGQCQAILLCDGDCKKNTELGICQALPENKTQLNVMAFFPCNVGGFRGRGLPVAAQMAVKKIAAKSNLLPNYRLKLIVDNTMCDQLAAIRAFINQLATIQQNSDQRYLIIGPGCSVGATTIAEIIPFYSLTQIGYTASSISLSDRRLYPNSLRAISSDNASVSMVTALVNEFGWRQVAVVSVRDILFTNLTGIQISALRQLERVTVLSEQLSFDSNPSTQELEGIVDQLERSGARIVLLNTYEDEGRIIFCLAHKRGMTYPNYTFISYYWWSEFWWTLSVDETNCTAQELTDAIFMSLSVDFFPSPGEDERDKPTDVFYTPNEFWADFVANLNALEYPRNEALRQAAYVYDAVWMAAFALHNASIELQNGAVPGIDNLEQFNHFRNSSLASKINELILSAARDTLFRGVSGKVKLNSFGDREPTRKLYQFRYTEVIDPNANNTPLEPFAFVDDLGELIFSSGQSVQTVFPGGVTVDVEVITINVSLFAVYTALAIVGVGFAVVCLLFNLVFRNKQVVKLSSPYLNILIIIGAILFYISAIFFGLDTGFAPREAVDILRCHFTVWLVSIGFSLLFGTMLVKTWRVYYIFKNIRLKKRPLKDWILFLTVMVMVAVDIVFLIIVSVDQFRVRLTEQPLILQPNGEIPQLFLVCESPASNIWIPILLFYKALYLVVGVFLAVQTYNVKLKRLRDSKLIVACVCATCVVALVGGIVGFTVDQPTIAYGVYGGFIHVVVTAILFILFGTLMIELAKNPSGKVEVNTARGSDIGSSYPDSSAKCSLDDQIKIGQLKETIQSLKDEIEVKKRLTLDLDHSNGGHVLSPVHSDEGSKTNLLRDSTTPSRVIDTPDSQQPGDVVANEGVLSPDHVEVQELQERPTEDQKDEHTSL